MIIHTVTA